LKNAFGIPIYTIWKGGNMFHYYIEEPVVPQKVVEKRWKETIEAKITNLKEYKKTIDKQIKEYQNDLEALT
tara:strand:+ start:432 stop:644 length:213 start_codon:yes stop_codon:yes gene_type:complete